MAPGSHCMSGNTCGCGMSWTYRWAIMVPRINTRGGRELKAIAPHIITPAVGVMCCCKAKAELMRSPRGLHTRTRLSSLLRLNLDSTLKTTWFLSPAVQFLHAMHHSKQSVDEWASRVAHVMGTVIPNVLQLGAFVLFEKTQGPLVKVLPVTGWRSTKQLAVRVHFLRCGGLLNDWSVEGVLSLVFV
ncbi:e3 ubiquitin-protein ligase RNF13 [Trichonephila clavipes]|uniref:E3 ubiquitin-protein ligase RNF13 n=1 Tax=Trichonephila clavipes TaxID=2585209 RepID=A0A8X6RFF1_TRICX|nr:e3 ubiquitin-protein ligase RNF13 [Trichonephila clavipes]